MLKDIQIDRFIMKSYPHITNAFKVCESEMIKMRELLVKNYVDCLFYDEIILQPQQR